MDPFTAIALVGNVLQFAVYVKDIYKRVREVQMSPSGISKADQEINTSTSRLHIMIDTITTASGQIGSSPTIFELQLHNLSKECRDIALELQDDIKSRSPKDRSRASSVLKSVLRSNLNRSDMTKRIKRLDQLQTTLFQHLIAYMRYARRHTVHARGHISSGAEGKTEALTSLLLVKNKVSLALQ